VSYLLTALVAYLIGSLPAAYAVTRVLTGRDIRHLGTGNVGVMNTIRHVGLPAGMIVFVAEGAKGAGAVELGWALTGHFNGAMLAAVVALVGVNWSCFLGFAGGRGSTLSAFALALIAPLPLAASAVLWLAIYGVRRDNFIATRLTMIGFPLLVLAIDRSLTHFAFAAGGSTVLLLRHSRAKDDHYQLARQPSRLP
jgi:glycerol-3-phosphate acyltransferase PlsY